MNNKEALKFFEDMANSKEVNENSVKLAHNSDFTKIDASFIMNYADCSTNILDIGTGLIVNEIYDKVKNIVCIEPYKNFTRFIKKSHNVEIVNSNILDYKTDKKFDLLTAFGIMHYFNEQEAKEIYKRLFSFLKYNGKLIVKNQFGIKKDIVVSGYSQEQKKNYFSSYRFLNKEIEILEAIGYKNIKTFDLYPQEANRWDNTHFYAIVAEKGMDDNAD